MKFVQKLLRRAKSPLKKTKSMEGSLKDASATSNTSKSTRTGESVEISLQHISEETTSLTREELQQVFTSLSRETGDESFTSDVTDVRTIEKRIAIAREHWNCVVGNNLRAARALVSDDMHVHFMDDAKDLYMDIRWDDWALEHERMCASFPDLSMRYFNVTHCCGAVVLQGVRFSGTHTGAAYAFGPCPLIETTHKYVENDPEEIYYFFQSGKEKHKDKICRIIVCPKGEMTGPAGFYTQLGGFPLL